MFSYGVPPGGHNCKITGLSYEGMLTSYIFNPIRPSLLRVSSGPVGRGGGGGGHKPGLYKAL